MSLVSNEPICTSLARSSLRVTAAFTSYYSGFLRFYQSICNAGDSTVTILLYHRISAGMRERLFNEDVIGPTARAFERQIAYLCERYKVIALESFVEAVQHRTRLPRRCAVITFDDGYKDNYNLAYPILRKYNAPATVFLATAYIGTDEIGWTDKLAYMVKNTGVADLEMDGLVRYDLRSEKKRLYAIAAIKKSLKTLPDEEKDSFLEKLLRTLRVTIPPGLGAGLFLSWADVREMRANGMSFGAHTATHPLLTRTSKERARSEIAESKRRIEEELDNPVEAFAYPNGNFDETIKTMVKEEGFACAVTTRQGINNQNSDLYELTRIGIPQLPFHQFAFATAWPEIRSFVVGT